MKVLCTADWHLKIWNDRDIGYDGLPKRLCETYDIIKQLSDYAMVNNIKHIIIAGDTNDQKHIVSVRAFVLLSRVIKQYPELHYHFLHGNHDSSIKVSTESAIELLTPENLTVYTKVTKIFDNIIMFPYSDNMVNDLNSLDGTDQILIGHFGVNEAQLSNGISLRTSITASDLDIFKLVILGHYHKPQHLDNIYYTGSLIQTKKDEAGEEKRFLVVDTETFEVQSIPTTGYRKYYSIEITEENKENIKDLLKEADDLKQQGNFVEVRSTLKELPAKLKLPDGINIIDDYEKDITLRGITSAMSVNDQMLKYLEIENISSNDIKMYMDIGIGILNREDKK